MKSVKPRIKKGTGPCHFDIDKDIRYISVSFKVFEIQVPYRPSDALMVSINRGLDPYLVVLKRGCRSEVC